MSSHSKKFHRLRSVLAVHREKAVAHLHRKHKHIKQVLKRHQIKIADIRQKGAKVATTGAIAGAFMAIPLAIHKPGLAKARELENINDAASSEEKRKFLERVMGRYGPKKVLNFTTALAKDSNSDIDIAKLNEQFPSRIKEIASALDPNTSPQYEEEVSNLIKAKYNIQAKVSLEDNRLNTYYGPLGAEQHLPRYPGDSAAAHTDDLTLRASGITPGRGAWGYWISSKNNLSSQAVDQERYYIAAQTFLAPGWRTDPKRLYEWFKYRKVVVVNPRNSKAVVAVIGDAGPASWTGKNFGGSPEVMQTLESHDGKGRDSVFVLFVDDPDNSIPLGPVENSEVLVSQS